MVPLQAQDLLFAPLPLLSVIVLLGFSIFILYSNTKKSKYIKLPPSPPKIPLLGNIHQIGALYHRSFQSLSRKYGPLMLVQLGQVPWLIVSSSELACAIMRKHDTTFASRPSGVTSDILIYKDIAFEPYGEDWRQVRKIFTMHLMSTKKVGSYKTIREEEVGNLIKKIGNHASLSNGEPLELSKLLFTFMLDVVCRVVSGKFIMEHGRYVLFREVIDENFRLLGQFSIGDLFPSFAWLENFVGLTRRANRNIKKWDKLLEEMIQAHADEKRGSNEGQESFVDILLSLKNDPSINYELSMEFIKGLLVIKRVLKFELLPDCVRFFGLSTSSNQDAFSAGVDTTFITLGWAMAELVKNPDTMKKLQDEVRGITKRNGMIKTEDLSEMEYLKAVIKETLRLHAPTPLLLPRQSMDECEINRFTIPKGTRILINCWAIQRDPRSWEAPEEFKPERFIASQVDYKGNDFQFIPFGAGRRICPGLLFATATAELALANLVHQFDWELPSGMTIDEFDMSDAPGLTVKRKESLKLVVKQVSVSD